MLAPWVVATPVLAQQVTDSLLAGFEKDFQSEMQNFNIPGSAVAIVQNGKIIYAKGFGVRSLETREPVTPSTVFRVGSTTKAMTSMMIATLVDQGLLSWDTPVIELYPTFKLPTDELTQKVTLRELMGMGTGLVSNITAPHWDEYSATDLLAALPKFTVAQKKGQGFIYNNEVYASAGYVAALASKPGQRDLLEVYKALMQTQVFGPIGMKTTALSENPASVSDDYAASYSFSLVGGPKATERVPYATINSLAPAGAVVSNVLDMARFLITQLSQGLGPEGVRVVSALNLAETWKPQTDIGEPFAGAGKMSYAMGWYHEPYGDVQIFRHGGGWDGFVSEMVMIPQAKAGLIILSNSSAGGEFNFVMRYKFIERLYGLGTTRSEKVDTAFGDRLKVIAANGPRFSPKVEASTVRRYLGNYDHGWSLEHREGGTLWLRRPGWEFQLLPTPEGFVISSGIAVGSQVRLGEGDKPTLHITIQNQTTVIAHK